MVDGTGALMYAVFAGANYYPDRAGEDDFVATYTDLRTAKNAAARAYKRKRRDYGYADMVWAAVMLVPHPSEDAPYRRVWSLGYY